MSLYDLSQAGQTQAAPSTFNGQYASAMQQPQESGIYSAIKEVIAEVSSNSAIASDLENALGIGRPVDETAKQPAEQTMVQVLRMAVYRLRSNNDRLGYLVKHINS